MNVRKHITNPKVVVEITRWRNGNIPKRHAPFMRAVISLSDVWEWREASLKGADGTEYRLLVQCRRDSKPNYKAWLSVRVTEKEYALVCRYESHSNHGGRHCHVLCDTGHYPVGEIEPTGLKCIPYWKKSTQDKLTGIGLDEAWNVAAKFYRIGIADEGQLI